MLQSAMESARLDFIIFLGAVAAPIGKAPIPQHLEAAFTHSLQFAGEFTREFLLSRVWEKQEFVYLLQALAALEGCRGPGRLLERMLDEEYESDCPKCNQYLLISVREEGFFSYAADKFCKPASPEIEVKPRPAINEPWNGVIDCGNNSRWLFGISHATGHTGVCFW